MIRTRSVVCVTISALLAAGCGRQRAPSLGIPDTTFVSTLSELRRIETDTTIDVTMRDSTRRMILRRHKVTSEKLEAASQILAQTPARASDLWRQIESIPRPAPIKGAAPVPPATSAPGNNHPVQH